MKRGDKSPESTRCTAKYKFNYIDHLMVICDDIFRYIFRRMKYINAMFYYDG